jgi:hypothetical protein
MGTSVIQSPSVQCVCQYFFYCRLYHMCSAAEFTLVDTFCCRESTDVAVNWILFVSWRAVQETYWAHAAWVADLCWLLVTLQCWEVYIWGHTDICRYMYTLASLLLTGDSMMWDIPYKFDTCPFCGPEGLYKSLPLDPVVSYTHTTFPHAISLRFIMIWSSHLYMCGSL